MTNLPAIYLFPYLRIKKGVSFGPWSLEPIDPKLLATSRDPIGTSLRALLSCHFDETGQPLTTGTVVVRMKAELDSPEEREQERQALQVAVTFAAIDSNAGDGNKISWEASGLELATAENAFFSVAVLPANPDAGFTRTRGGELNKRFSSGGTIRCGLTAEHRPEGLVSLPVLKLNPDLLEAVFQISLSAQSENASAIQRQVASALHWHGRAWENSPLHTMPDILVQLKTAIEALSGQHRTAEGIPELEKIYASIVGVIDAKQFLWQGTEHRIPRTFGKKTVNLTDFGDWYSNLAETRNMIVHATLSPEMDYVAQGSPFSGNIFHSAERVTRELIKIRLAQLGFTRAALSSTAKALVDHANAIGRGHEISLIAALTP